VRQRPAGFSPRATTMTDVIIVGAGITGLTCAWRLKRLGIETQVLERFSRPGGVIETERAGEYLIEKGPNTLLPSSDNFPLLDESGLTTAIVEGDRRAPRYICVNGTLRKAPFGPMTAAGLMRAAAEPFVRSRSPVAESIHDFFVRRTGNEAEERLVSPFVTGIYAGNTRELSMAATFPKLVDMERRHGSLVLGMMKSRKPKGVRRGHTCSFAAGMETLPRRLAAGLDVSYNTNEVEIAASLQVRWAGRQATPKALVITIPAYAAAQIVAQLLPDAAGMLSRVDYAPMVIATTSIADKSLPDPLRGFGFLVPRSEKLHLLGTLFSSALFPGRAPHGRQLLTSFVGGSFEPDAIGWPDERIWETVQGELQKVLKASSPPEPLRIVRRTHAIPQYKIGHEQLVVSLKNEIRKIPGLFLAGNYIDGVSVSACMEAGERTARDVAAFLGKTS